MTRKMLSIVLAVIVSVTSLLSGNILAAYIPPDAPQYSYISLCNSTLTISGNTATCKTSVTGNYNETTKIVIAQRISSIEDADQIIILDDGKIDAIGTHEELLKNNAIYQEVYYTQNKKGGTK